MMPLIPDSAPSAPNVSSEAAQIAHGVEIERREARRLRMPAARYRELCDEASSLRSSMDMVESLLDNRPPETVCRFCGCADDNRCAVPAGQFGFTRCAWNFDFQCCTSPLCLAKAQRLAREAEAPTRHMSMAESFRLCSETHSWKPFWEIA